MSFSMETQGPARIGFQMGGSSMEHPDAERERERRRRQAGEEERAAAHREQSAPEPARGERGQVEGEEAADAVQNTIRSNFLECTTGISGGAPAGTLQAHVQATLVESRTALPGAGAMRCELSAGAVEALRVTTAMDFVGGSASVRTRAEYTAGKKEKKMTKLHGVKDEMHDDFPKARRESEYLAHWITKALAGKS